jgi:predicted O-linked N-acetylglucosamine transferase (SPINDLY family)
MDMVSKALACLRLAPVQAASWGHPETTGLPTIDFFLSAQLMEPPESVHLYSEKLVRLPNLGTCFENTSIQVVTPDLSALGIDSQSPILLCAGSPSKYNPNHDQVLVQIAQKLGACQFVFFNFSENLTAILKERLIESFKKANLDANQFLRFIPFLKKEEFHGLMQASDLYLDTIGFSGFNTAMQALASGLPIVAFEGPQMRGCLASSILSRINLRELVCSSESEYIDLIVELLQNRQLLNSVKIKMNQSKEVLFNDLEPIRELEKFLIEQVQKNN